MGPGGVVLYLSHLHCAALREVGVSTETQVVVPAVEIHLRRARAEVRDHAIWKGPAFKGDFCFLEAVADLVDEMGGEGVRPIGSDGVS